MSELHRVFVTLALLPLASCRPGVDLGAERALLQEADARYTATANAGDVDGLTSLYAADATRYPPDGAPARGLDEMRAFATRVASTPDFHLTRTPLALHVARGGDMGYTLNLLELRLTGPDGEPVVEWLRDLHIWRKEADGAWRIVEDIWQVLELGAVPGD
ncbi:MAG TPA: DUF4440 domain-containing protein [Longimicrobiales bacterium]|nr:DUF4440 domain-containing protein [Longimicrobiales bacterium]